jgi:4-hydroxy-4-methyl-2-oxoglutarate aldolase
MELTAAPGDRPVQSDLSAILEGLREFDTALLANTIGYIDRTPAHEYYMGGSIQSVTPSIGPTVGVAATCEMDTSTPGSDHEFDLYLEQLDQIGRTAEPVIWVVKAVGSRPDHECIMGDGMAKDLTSMGCIAIVTDGGVRDVAGMMTLPFAAYSRGTTIHHCGLRVRSINRPVEVGGITVSPGDMLHANHEGVIKIPPGCLGILSERARQMRVFEYEAHEVLRSRCIPVAEKRQKVGALLRKFGFAR